MHVRDLTHIMLQQIVYISVHVFGHTCCRVRQYVKAPFLFPIERISVQLQLVRWRRVSVVTMQMGHVVQLVHNIGRCDAAVIETTSK